MALQALVWKLIDKSKHGFLQTRLMIEIGLFSVHNEDPDESEAATKVQGSVSVSM